MPLTRRSFLTRSAAAAGAATVLPQSLFGRTNKAGANDRITVAGIGLGRRGRRLLRSFLDESDVRFVAIADVQQTNREIIRRTVNRHYGNEDCAAYSDMREILDRQDIDAVVIATADRWHGTASIMAARAGKDIFCEKPCAMTIEEARQLDEEVKKAGRIFQGGMQRRNVANFEVAVALARSGKLGKLHTLHAGIWLPQPVRPDLPGEPEPPADELDWNAWLGPAPYRPYNQEYVRGQWRYYDGLSAGWGLHDWASHTANLCQWAADADDTVPVDYWTEDDRLCARYANGLKLVMRVAGQVEDDGWLGLGSCPVRFEGDDGWVEAGDTGKIALSNESLLDEPPPEVFGIDATKHIREFLDAVKTRGATACDSTITRHTEIACHASAINWKLGRELTFDPATESFPGDDEANALRSRPRREPFTI